MLLVTGAFMIFSLLSFSTVRNSLICPIQFGTATLHIGYGGSFWLTLAIGKDTKIHQGRPPCPSGCARVPVLSLPRNGCERAWAVHPARAPAFALAKQILAEMWRGLAEGEYHPHLKGGGGILVPEVQ